MNARHHPLLHKTLLLTLMLITSISTFFISHRDFTTFYSYSQRPEWILPLYVVIPLWIGFYILMTICALRLLRLPHSLPRSYALGAWAAQWLLASIWPVTFFKLQWPIVTPLIVTFLLLALLLLISYSLYLDRLSGLLLIPYLCFITYKVIFHWTFYILDLRLL